MELNSLLKQAQQHDTQALEKLHDLLYPVVYKYVHYRLEDEQVCEDISSDVFVRLLDALFKKASQIRDLRAWLLGTAFNLIQDHLRQKYRWPMENLEEQDDLSDEQTLEQSINRTFTRHQLQKAMQALTSEQQHVLALRFSQDLSINDTAEIMGKSVNAVKVLQFRALASLRRILEEEEN
jgi:RNA polymerase sigma-70 factor (ECF subfamily)